MYQDLNDEVGIYLQNTAAAISALAQLQRNKSLRGSSIDSTRKLPCSPTSPMRQISPNSTSPASVFRSPIHLTDDELHHYSPARRLHSHNRSTTHGIMDSGLMTCSTNSELLPSPNYEKNFVRRSSLNTSQIHYPIRRSFEDDEECMEDIVIVEKGKIFTRKPSSSIKALDNTSSDRNEGTPLKKSCSFSAKAQANHVSSKKGMLSDHKVSKIQKSMSSSNFGKLHIECDDGDPEDFVTYDHFNPDPDYSTASSVEEQSKDHITNTRYNKAFLMRVEQSKRAITGNTSTNKPGQLACPNTPEASKRLSTSRSRKDRASLPRDSSLNRLSKNNIDLINLKKQSNFPSKEISSSMIKSTSSITSNQSKTAPKYLDISKYKPAQGQNQSFLRKDETKSTLVKTEVKRSPSSVSVLGSRGDTSRTSTRSIKSAGAKPSVKRTDSFGNFIL